MIIAINPLLHCVVVIVAAILLSGDRGSVIVQAVEVIPDAHDATAAGTSIVSPWDEKHRALQGSTCFANYPTGCPSCFIDKSCCMRDNYVVYKSANSATSLSCGASSVNFISVDGFRVADGEARACNCGCTGCPTCNSADPTHVSCKALLGGKIFPTGTVIGACRGIDDVVTVQFDLTIEVKPEFDIGLYINTVGGNGEYESRCRRDILSASGGCFLCRLTLFTSRSHHRNRRMCHRWPDEPNHRWSTIPRFKWKHYYRNGWSRRLLRFYARHHYWCKIDKISISTDDTRLQRQCQQ
jgi:hypothetical protein